MQPPNLRGDVVKGVVGFLHAMRSRADYFVILLITIAQVGFWFVSGGLPFGANSSPMPQPGYFVEHYLYAWNSWIDNGNSIPLGVNFPFSFLAIFSIMSLQVSYPDSLKIFTTLWLFIGALCVYHLTGLLVGSENRVNVRAASLVATALYVFNFYWITVAEDIFSWVLIVGSIPLFLYSFLSALKKNSLRYALLASIAVLMMGQSFPSSSAFFIFSSFGTAIACLYFIFKRSDGRYNRLVVTVRIIAVVLVVSASLSSYWIASFFLNQANYSSALSNKITLLFPESFPLATASSPINVIRFVPWTWFTENLNPAYAKGYFSNPIVYISTFVLPVVAFSNLMFMRNRRTTLAILLVTFAVFLTTGSTTPLSSAFWQLLTDTAIGKILYRSSITGYLNPFIMLGYSILASVSLGRLVKISPRPKTFDIRTPRLKKSGVVRLVSTCVIVGLIMLSLFPIYSGRVLEWHANSYSGNGVHLPTYYQEANTWLASHDGGGSVLVMPNAGLWPTLQWGDGSGYQGINPYPALLNAIPVITGAGYSYGSSSSHEPLIGLAYSSMEDPTFVNSLLGPCYNCPNFAGNVTHWASNPGYHDIIQWDNTSSFHGSRGVLELLGNNSASFGNPNGNGIAYIFNGPVDFSYAQVVMWVKTQGITPNDVFLEIGYGSSGGGYLYFTKIASTLDGWSELIFTLDPSNHSGLMMANALFILYQTPTQNGQTLLWIGSTYPLREAKSNSSLVSHILTLLNVEYVFLDEAIISRYAISDGTILQNSTIFRPVFAEGNSTLYQNLQWSQGFYAAGRGTFVDSLADLARFLSSNNDPYSTVLVSSESLETQTTHAPIHPANVTLARTTPTTYVFHISSVDSFFFVLSQSFSTGWSAQIHGSTVSNHFLVNLYANGWVLPRGDYELVVNYSPQQLYSIGILVSILSAAVVSAILLVSPFKSKLKRVSSSIVSATVVHKKVDVAKPSINRTRGAKATACQRFGA